MKKYKYRKRFEYHGKMYSVYADTLVELGRKYAEKLASLENDPKIIDEHTTMAMWADRCIDTYKMNMSEDPEESSNITSDPQYLNISVTADLSILPRWMCRTL